MIQQQQQKTNQWVLTSVQFNLVSYLIVQFQFCTAYTCLLWEADTNPVDIDHQDGEHSFHFVLAKHQVARFPGPDNSLYFRGLKLPGPGVATTYTQHTEV